VDLQLRHKTSLAIGANQTSAAYGHTVGGIAVLSFATTAGARVDYAWLSARFEIDIAGKRVPVRASLRAPYDPVGVRMKA